MDTETLLRCGRVNLRFHRLVCDKLVWRSLLRGIHYFPALGGETGQGEDEDEERMDELIKFVVERGSSEMKAELVNEVASRFSIRSSNKNFFYFCSKKGKGCRFISPLKVTVSIQGWDDAPDTFEMGESHLKELHSLAQTVGTEFIVKEVKNIYPLIGYTEDIKLVVALVDQQEEGLDKLELQSVDFPSLQKKHQADSIFSLIKASKEWKVEEVSLMPTLLGDDSTFWAALAKNAGTGHIGTLEFPPIYKENMQRARKEDVKAVWEIAEKLRHYFYNHNGGTVIGAGRGEEPKTTWEEAYETLLENMF